MQPTTKRRFSLIALLLGALVLLGAISERNVEPRLRTREVFIPRLFDPSVVATSTDTGYRGVVAAIGIDNIVAPVWTTSISAMPYASRLDIRMQDVSSNSVLTCSSVAIRGLDAHGYQVTETVTSITEAESRTVHAYERVDRIAGAGCNVFAGSDDYLVVAASDEIGLPLAIKVVADVLSICRYDNAAAAAGNCTKSTGYTINDAYDVLDLKMNDDDMGVFLDDHDSVLIRMRGSRR